MYIYIYSYSQEKRWYPLQGVRLLGWWAFLGKKIEEEDKNGWGKSVEPKLASQVKNKVFKRFVFEL